MLYIAHSVFILTDLIVIEYGEKNIENRFLLPVVRISKLKMDGKMPGLRPVGQPG